MVKVSSLGDATKPRCIAGSDAAARAAPSRAICAENWRSAM
jgi:hypothetical protein